VYYVWGELKNDDWRFVAGLQPDVFNPLNPSIIYISKMYGSGNTGTYRGRVGVERFWENASDFGVTWQGSLGEPISTLVTSNAKRLVEDNGWPNLETRLQLGFGPRGDIRGSQIRPLEIGVSGVVGQLRTRRTLLGDPADIPPQAVIDTWGIGSDFVWWAGDVWGARGEVFYGKGLGEYNAGVL
jgi:hypothetical protein